MSLKDANESVNAKYIYIYLQDPLTTKKGKYFPKINFNLSHKKKFIFAKNSILTEDQIHIEKNTFEDEKGVIFGKIITPLIIYSELGVQQDVE